MECHEKEQAREEMMSGEANAYFERNLSDGQIQVGMGCKLLDEFLAKIYSGGGGTFNVLEIGCCYGYNLIYLCKKYGFKGFGIEPSLKAVQYGEQIICSEKEVSVVLKQGTADQLDFADNSFDIVIMAFCMFWVDRKYMMRAVSEADRVLKTGGYLASWDFDTRIPYRRLNVHNENVPTYKYDLANLFLGNPQYYLVEKRSFSHASDVFHKDIQERCALNILYKEQIGDAYVFN